MEQWLLDHGEWLIPIAFILGFSVLLVRQICVNRAPEYIAEATVESHQAQPARYHGRWSSGWNHTVTFLLKDGSALTLYTSQQDFLALKDGQSVTIRWQNENLLNYE